MPTHNGSLLIIVLMKIMSKMTSRSNSFGKQRTCSQNLPLSKFRQVVHRRNRERGVFAIMSAPLFIVLLAFSALAVELGMVYNRVVDLHGMAKSVAVAAALRLDGTPEGIKAAQAIAKSTAESMKYMYFEDGVAFTWNDAALTFSTTHSRSGTWLDASSANGQSSGLYYVKVDTISLDASISTVETIFIKALSPSLEKIQVRESAVAGRTAINVTPLAICAMGAKATARNHTSASGTTVSELVQYGFRRGVSYDLMQLNPNGELPTRYAVNPVVAPGGASTSFNTSTLGQFVCTGSMWVPRLSGGSIRVSALASTAPLSNLHIALNSRFDKFTGGPCDPSGAPPDFNIKAYEYDVTDSVRWMSPGTGSRAANPVPKPSRLETVADLATPTGPASAYGPLWAYAKAVKAPNPVDSPEPSAGYAEFSTNDWPTLYKTGPTASGYPTASATPYLSTGANNSNYLAPRAGNLELSSLYRRVLNIPLLACSPEPTGSNIPASVQAIGKFFMTVPATSDSLIAEFAGVLQEASLVRQVELFP